MDLRSNVQIIGQLQEVSPFPLHLIGRVTMTHLTPKVAWNPQAPQRRLVKEEAPTRNSYLKILLAFDGSNCIANWSGMC